MMMAQCKTHVLVIQQVDIYIYNDNTKENDVLSHSSGLPEWYWFAY